MQHAAQHTAESPSTEDRRWAALAHIGGPVGILLSMGLLGFLVPLVVWIAKRDDSSWASEQAREALNFQLTLLGLHMAGWIFAFFTLGLGLLVVWPAFFVLGVAMLVLGCYAAFRTFEGQGYRYPATLRLL